MYLVAPEMSAAQALSAFHHDAPTFPVPMTALANINVLGTLANVSGEVGKQTSTFITVQVRH
jgi:hypothetical protein